MTLRNTLTTVLVPLAAIGLAIASMVALADVAVAQDPTATPEPTPTPDDRDPQIAVDLNPEEESVAGDSFEPETPNPQPSEPLPAAQSPDDAAAADATTTDDAAADTADTTAADATDTTAAATDSTTTSTDEVQGQAQLAFTGPDTRIMLLGVLLLGVGVTFVVTGRRQRDRWSLEDSWVE